MKIVKKGRPQKAWSHEYKCTGAGNGDKGCGAVLLVEEEDLYRQNSHNYGGGHGVFATFRCPACSVQTDAKDVPTSVTIGRSEPRRK